MCCDEEKILPLEHSSLIRSRKWSDCFGTLTVLITLYASLSSFRTMLSAAAQYDIGPISGPDLLLKSIGKFMLMFFVSALIGVVFGLICALVCYSLYFTTAETIWLTKSWIITIRMIYLHNGVKFNCYSTMKRQKVLRIY